VGLAHQPINNDMKRGWTCRGIGIEANHDEGGTKTEGEGIDIIFIVFRKAC
jgi:hypothetical protein